MVLCWKTSPPSYCQPSADALNWRSPWLIEPIIFLWVLFDAEGRWLTAVNYFPQTTPWHRSCIPYKEQKMYFVTGRDLLNTRTPHRHHRDSEFRESIVTHHNNIATDEHACRHIIITRFSPYVNFVVKNLSFRSQHRIALALVYRIMALTDNIAAYISRKGKTKSNIDDVLISLLQKWRQQSANFA